MGKLSKLPWWSAFPISVGMWIVSVAAPSIIPLSLQMALLWGGIAVLALGCVAALLHFLRPRSPARSPLRSPTGRIRIRDATAQLFGVGSDNAAFLDKENPRAVAARTLAGAIVTRVNAGALATQGDAGPPPYTPKQIDWNYELSTSVLNEYVRREDIDEAIASAPKPRGSIEALKSLIHFGANTKIGNLSVTNNTAHGYAALMTTDRGGTFEAQSVLVEGNLVTGSEKKED